MNIQANDDLGNNNDSTKIFFTDWLENYLRQHGINTYVFNPGASFRAFHESIVHSGENRLFMTCHEEIAVAFAHGYYKASHKNICVLIHSNVGLLHSTMALFNAWCDRVPVLCLVGNGPLNSQDRRLWIDWIHTSHDIFSPVRGYSVFTATSIDQIGTGNDIRRALRIIQSEKYLGPVLVALDTNVQEAEIENDVNEFQKMSIIKKNEPINDEYINLIVDKLKKSKRPIVLVERAGRQKGMLHALERLTNSFSENLPIIECGYYENTISSVKNNNHYREECTKLSAMPDFVLALDTVDPAGHIKKLSNENIITENIFFSINTPGTPIDSWSADTVFDSPGYIFDGDLVSSIISISNKLNTINLDTNYIKKAIPKKTDTSEVIECLYEVLSTQKLKFKIVNGGSTNIDYAIRNFLPFDCESQFLGMNGGGGLGYGLPASLGAAVAMNDISYAELPITFLGDGDFLYTTSALWTATAKKIPILIIIINNAQYSNSVQHAQLIASLRNRDTCPRIATTFDEKNVNFVEIASGFGIKAKTILMEDRFALKKQLIESINFVTAKKEPYLLNIVVEQ